MRILLIVLFMLFSANLMAQDGYVFTKEQHDQIRKNLADYRILIKDYDNLSMDFKNFRHKFDSLVKQFEFYKELHSKTNSEVKRFEVLYSNSEYENKKLKTYIEELNKKFKDIEPEMARKDRMILHWKGKFYRERKYDKGERIIANFVWATMASCTALLIYTTIDRKHN